MVVDDGFNCMSYLNNYTLSISGLWKACVQWLGDGGEEPASYKYRVICNIFICFILWI